MFRMTGAASIIILLSGLFSGPFIHLHEQDGAHGEEHGGLPLVHAHLPESHTDVDEDGAVHIEPAPELEHGTSLDVFILEVESAAVQLFVLDRVRHICPPLPTVRIPVFQTTERSHGPPVDSLTAPRSPPLLPIA